MKLKVKSKAEWTPGRRALWNAGLTVAVLGACTGVSALLNLSNVQDVELSFLMLYVLGVVCIAILTDGYIYSMAASLASVLIFDFLFTVPYISFEIHDLARYLIPILLMLLIGLAISTVTYMLKRRMRLTARLTLEKYRAEAELDGEREKATLLRSISHDLRTPLTAIASGAELLAQGGLSEEEGKEVLSDIRYKAEWTGRLLENLLNLTRIDAQKLTVKKTAEAVEEILPQAVRNVRGLLGGRTVRYEIPDELLLVPMDATLIVQALTNLLSNAVRHTPENGNIRLQVFSTGKNAVFRVKNDGPPVEEADLPHIFELYYTAADSRPEHFGLGLSICRTIVLAHGGDIEARNAEGGVVFEFYLPLEEEKDA